MPLSLILSSQPVHLSLHLICSSDNSSTQRQLRAAVPHRSAFTTSILLSFPECIGPPAATEPTFCKTLGVPNRVRPEKLETQRNKLQTDLDLSDQRRIGVLIGGEDRYYTITETTAARLIEILQQFATKWDSQLLLTTSRRTPLPVENLISKCLSNTQYCPILVLAHGENSAHGSG